MMTTERIPLRQAVEGAVLAMAMTMTMGRVRRTYRAARTGPGKGRVQKIRKGKVRRLRTGRGKGMGRGRESIKRKVLINTPQQEMIVLVPFLYSWRRKCPRQIWTWRANTSEYV